MPEKRLSTAFHESFALSLPSISAILKLASESGGPITEDAIRASTSLGSNYVKAMPQYARGCGLMAGSGRYSLTPLGEVVSRRDPNLIHPATLWVVHYHLSAPQGPGPEFWSYLVTHSLPFHEEIQKANIISSLADFLEGQRPGKSLAERTVRSASTIFVGTYTKSDGLGLLRFLQAMSRDGTVRVSGPKSPPLGALLYALSDYWQAHYGDQTTVSLDELARDDGFARVMWMDSQALVRKLDELRRNGAVDLYRVAPPYQVVRLWPGKDELLDKLFD